MVDVFDYWMSFSSLKMSNHRRYILYNLEPFAVVAILVFLFVVIIQTWKEKLFGVAYQSNVFL